MAVTKTCQCGAEVTSADEATFGDAFLVHVRANHEDWPYPDVAVRNYGEALLRLSGPAERLDAIGEIEIVPVVGGPGSASDGSATGGTHERVDDWTSFFDHDGFVGRPEWAACYCTEPHLLSRISDPPAADDDDGRTWRDNRATMQDLLRSGRSFGYLAYVDGRPAGWVNASKRSEYALFRMDDGEDGDVIGVSCFVIAPPYRRHGLAGRLLDRVVADAADRGAAWVEAYPFVGTKGEGDANFRGPRSLYEERGFEPVDERERYTVMRKAVSAPGS